MLTLNICGGVSFDYTYESVEWTAQMAYKEHYYRRFAGDFAKLQKQHFFQRSPEKCMT